MALPIFNPSVRPSPGTTHSPELALNGVDLGDGYSLAQPMGMNHVRQIVSLRWDGLTLAQMQELRAFLEERGGYKPFLYEPRGNAAPLRWTCREWSWSDSSPWTLACTFRQDFALA